MKRSPQGSRNCTAQAGSINVWSAKQAANRNIMQTEQTRTQEHIETYRRKGNEEEENRTGGGSLFCDCVLREIRDIDEELNRTGLRGFTSM